LRTLVDRQVAIADRAAKGLRPKFMTVGTMFVGPIPIRWATGTGSDAWNLDRRADGRRDPHGVRSRSRRLSGDPAVGRRWTVPRGNFRGPKTAPQTLRWRLRGPQHELWTSYALHVRQLNRLTDEYSMSFQP
jgi:hypothetical protein